MGFMFCARMRLCGLLLLLYTLGVSASARAHENPPWRELEPGMELCVFTPASDRFHPINIVVLRLDPEAVDFVLLSASERGESLSLAEWADSAGLAAAINASMYLPDARTSTGYMRNGEHENNARIVKNFGAFFVAGPRIGRGDGPHNAPDLGLPRARLLDRDEDDWHPLLSEYDVVVQNYRLISAGGRMLWVPGGPSYAVAALGQDRAGRILFIHCREPMTGAEFGEQLQALPLDLRVVMYVEGGPQAGLLVRAGDVNEIWVGRHVADFLTSGNKAAPLPNVIGARRRAARTEGKP